MECKCESGIPKSHTFLMSRNHAYNYKLQFHFCNLIYYKKYRFGHLACFTSDIEMFLEVLTPDKKAELLEKFKESSVSISAVPAKVLGQSITLFKIQELIGNMSKLPVVGEPLDSCVC